MDNYDIENGILGMGKIVSGRLSQYLNDDKRRWFYGMGQEQYENKSEDNVFYKKLKKPPKFEVISGRIKKLSPNIFLALDYHTVLKFKDEIYPHTGTYILNLEVVDNSPISACVSRYPFEWDDEIYPKVDLFKVHTNSDWNSNGDIIKLEVNTNNFEMRKYVNGEQQGVEYYFNMDLVESLYFKVSMADDWKVKILSIDHIL
jgi:hypothetical protein